MLVTKTEQAALLGGRSLQEEQGHAHHQLIHGQLLKEREIARTSVMANAATAKERKLHLTWPQSGRSCCIRPTDGRQSPPRSRQRWETRSSCSSSSARSFPQRCCRARGLRSRAAASSHSSSAASASSTCGRRPQSLPGKVHQWCGDSSLAS